MGDEQQNMGEADDRDRRRDRREIDRRAAHIEYELEQHATMLLRHDSELRDITERVQVMHSILLGTEGQGGLMRAVEENTRALEKLRMWAILAVLTFVGGFGGTVVTIATHH